MYICGCIRLKDVSGKLIKQGFGSPAALRNVVVHQVVVGTSHVAFLLQVQAFNRFSFITTDMKLVN